MKLCLYYTVSLLLLIFPTFAIAQRQPIPQVQQKSLRAPENVNADGKATEWKYQYQAYNNTTQVFYTMANDDDKLYLVVHATDPLVIRKIIAGGITLSINAVESKNNKGGIIITYPFFNKNNWPEIGLRKRPRIIKDTLVKIELIDSFMRSSNYQLDQRSKQIKFIGAKGMKDTLVSVYNEAGINAAAQFDEQLNYNYELAVPLKYLGLSLNGLNTFAYKLILNGSNFAEGNTIEDIKGGGTRIKASGDNKLVPMADMQFIRYPTYLTGSYTLAKSNP